jgi:hypothetical protein
VDHRDVLRDGRVVEEVAVSNVSVPSMITS